MEKKIVLKFEFFISNLEIYVITYILVQDLDNNQYTIPAGLQYQHIK